LRKRFQLPASRSITIAALCRLGIAPALLLHHPVIRLVLCMAVDRVTMPFEPVTLHTPLSAVTTQFTIYLAGFVIALVYFSPLRELYARSTKTV